EGPRPLTFPQGLPSPRAPISKEPAVVLRRPRTLCSGGTAGIRGLGTVPRVHSERQVFGPAGSQMIGSCVGSCGRPVGGERRSTIRELAQFVGCVKRTTHYILRCVSRTLR